MCWMVPATTKSQAILQHAGGIATSSGWGHRPGHTCSLCTWEMQTPDRENISALVSIAARLRHEDGVPWSRTVSCQTEPTHCCLWYKDYLIIIPYQSWTIAWVCRELLWVVSLFGEVQQLQRLGASCLSDVFPQLSVSTCWRTSNSYLFYTQRNKQLLTV